ncbi:RNA-binding protein 28 [Clarias gariepinus]|uniref:RNA-binding protein 28 n=1 Tax=Clarias gariepinus TaxID=13013 RepID=UPI00234DC133|nr:RNA-binding protein 28 [Clarias gariepinus]
MEALTLFVRNLPASASSEHLEEIFSEVGPIKRCFVVKDKGSEKCRGIGYVTYSMVEDAERALREIKDYDGKKIFVVHAKKKLYEKKQKKNNKAEQKTEESPEEPPEVKSQPKSQGLRKNKMKARLIVRNLSFKCSEAELKEVFSKHGTVLEVKIPVKPDGKKRGFAFVQFRNMLEAGKALAATNLKKIKDRLVAVDWAVSKDKFVANQQGSASGGKKEESAKVAEAEEEDDEEDDVPAEKQSKVKTENESEAGSPSDNDDDDDDDDDQSKDSDDEEDEKHDDSMESDSDATDDEDDDDDDEDDEEDDDDDDDDDEEEEKAKKKKKPKNLLPSDVNEGRTIFIRNLSFDSEEEGVEEILLQFGELEYVRIVMHPDTGLSKGCAFAQFKTKEGADKCLAAAQTESEGGGVRVDGRKLIMVLAVSREDASKLKSKTVKTHKGSRNLYLAREGLIRAGTKAAEGVSESDMAKRMRFAELKKAKLKDVNVFVSQTRLCVHNLPKSVDRKRLFKICLSAAGGGKGVRIKECHVMYDRKPVRGEPVGQSLGYGFVEFQEHEHALQALRHLNNNPKIFTANKRPIVEFSLEDGRKLKLKAMREQKSKMTSAAVSRPEKKKGNRVGSQEDRSKQPPQRSPKSVSAVVQKSAGAQKGSEKKPGALSTHFSGFRTNPEVEHIEAGDGKKRQKILPMPSHIGPKIRNRDKGKKTAQVRKVKTAPSRNERKKLPSMEKSVQNKTQNAKPVKRKFQNREEDRFERLVEQYKKKLTGGSNSKDSIVKKSKWFS